MSYRVLIADALVHQAAATLEEITAGVGRLCLVAHRMGERGLDHLTRRIRLLRGPVPETRPEPMRHVYIKARTTQLNGKVERSHHTDKQECGGGSPDSGGGSRVLLRACGEWLWMGQHLGGVHACLTTAGAARRDEHPRAVGVVTQPHPSDKSSRAGMRP